MRKNLSITQNDDTQVDDQLKSKGKHLPTSTSKKTTKKHFIKEYAKNRPLNAKEIANLANKIGTTPNYVHKILSCSQK